MSDRKVKPGSDGSTLSKEEQRKLNISLYNSASKGSVEGVQEVLSLGADINNTDNFFRETPLLAASRGGHTKIVEVLLLQKPDPNIGDKYGKTPLHVARNKDIAECLINNGANVSVLTKPDGNTVLHTACQWGCDTAVIDYLILKGLGVESCNKYGETPLHLADNERIAKHLVDQYGADINVLTDDGNTVLHTACKYGHIEILGYLIKTKGLKLDTLNKYGETLLHLARAEWIAKHLVDQYGADINVLTEDGNTVLHTACKYGHDNVLNYLIKTKGLKLDTLNKYGETPLHLARDERTVKHLVDQYGADINVLTDDGNTVLHTACKYGHGFILDYLIKTKGLKLDTLNKSNQTPIDILKLPTDDEMISFGRSFCLDWLQDKGHYKGSNDYIPLWKKAAEEGTVDTIWTNVSIGGASGVGKTSFACLVLDQPPPIHHHSTDVIQPLPIHIVDTAHNEKDKATGNNPDDGKLDDDGIGHTTTDSTSSKEGPARVQDTSKQTTASSNQDEADGVKSHMVLSDGQCCQWKMADRMELYKKLAKCALAHKLSKKASIETPETPQVDSENPATSRSNTTSTQHVSPASNASAEPVNRSPEDALSENEQIRRIEELQSSRDILELIAELPETCDKLDETHFVHLLDTGGQASLIDIAPALVRFNSVNVLVLKLNEPLTDAVNFFYSVEGEVKGREYRNMTNEELLASLIAARRNIKRPEVPGVKEDDLVKPKLIIIGTHYDRYKEMERNKELKETISEKEERLLKLLNLEEADFYCYNPEKDQFIFPMNTMSREPAELEIASQIRKIACQTYMQAPIPLRWYLVQLELNQMKAENKDIVQVKGIVKFCFDIYMDQEAVRASLKYFHVLTICLYFPQVLPDIVFLSPDYLAKQIGRIAAVAMCKSEHTKLTNDEVKLLVDEGIFDVSLLKKIGMEFTYESFTVDDFMKLLEHLFVVICTTDKQCSLYFMPSLLPISRENILDTLPQSSEVDPVSLKWENAMPSGMLSSVSMAMCQSTVTAIEKPSRKPQYRNKITLYCRDLECSLMLFEYAKCLGVAHNSSLANDSPVVLKAVMEGIKSVVNKFNWVEGVSQPSVGFLIPSSSPDGNGTIYHYYQRSNRNPNRLVCHELEYKSIEIHIERQLPWFLKVPNNEHTDTPYSEESNQSTTIIATAMLTDSTPIKSANEHNQGQVPVLEKKSTNPSLVLDQAFDLLRNKSAQWNKIGQAMRVKINDRESLRRDVSLNDSGRLEMVINIWLESATPSWVQFIAVLRNLQYNDVIAQIEEQYKQPSSSTGQHPSEPHRLCCPTHCIIL